MLILLTYPSLEIVPAAKRSRNILDRSDLADACDDTVAQALRAAKPDVVLTRSPIAPAALAAWRTSRSDVPLLVVDVGVAGDGSRAGTVDDGVGLPGIGYRRANDTVQALRIAEQAWNDAVSTAPLARPSTERSVTLVGAGVVNLITALRLLRANYDVVLYDKAPDPRDNADWTAYGCTRGGGDGRMFTLTEADSYNNRARESDGKSNNLLERPISDQGWLLAKPGSLSNPERQWARDFHEIPPWLAESYNEDIFDVNRAAQTLWEDLIRDSGLFDDSTGYRDGILRLYTEADYFRRHIVRNKSVGAAPRELTTSEVGAEYPALEDACANGTVAGGIEVVGFTVNIHKFMAKLINMLERAGAKFHWDEPVTGIRWESGVADGIETNGGIVSSRHYVLSPGAYGDELLKGTASQGKIQGMLGVWLTVPNVEPLLEHSAKIFRKGHEAEETNVTLATNERGEPTLICGAGYGWTGLNPGNINTAELEVLFNALEDTIRRFFPRAHRAARDAGILNSGRRICVRPWTASCLGVFERVETRAGGTLIVTGGHNTGGFAQSPVVAEAVLAAIEGREHTMHTRYHPRRLERFSGDAIPGTFRPA